MLDTIYNVSDSENLFESAVPSDRAEEHLFARQ